jgi:hypothetical protein
MQEVFKIRCEKTEEGRDAFPHTDRKIWNAKNKGDINE